MLTLTEKVKNLIQETNDDIFLSLISKLSNQELSLLIDDYQKARNKGWDGARPRIESIRRLQEKRSNI